MSQIVEGLLEYLKTTSSEQIEADWAALAIYDDVDGPTADEFISESLKYRMQEVDPWDIKIPETIQNPEFSSDFFLTKLCLSHG